MVRGEAAQLPDVMPVGVDLVGIIHIERHLERQRLAAIRYAQAQPVPGIAAQLGIAAHRPTGHKTRLPLIRSTDPVLGVRSIVAQCASSKPGCAHAGEPFTHGESPGANFHGPGSVTAELPSVMVCVGEPACGCACAGTNRNRYANKMSEPILRMFGRVTTAKWRKHDVYAGFGCRLP